MFTINIEYKSGDSFNTYETEDTISIVWENKELARKALKAIKEHRDFLKSTDEYGLTPSEVKTIHQNAKKKKWYSSESPQYMINVELDDGTYKAINAFWCGYFETIRSAEVVTCSEEDNEDKIIF